MMNVQTSDAPTPDAAFAAQTGRIACCALLGAIGYSSYSALPILLGLFAIHRNLAEVPLGWIGSAEMLGLLVGSLLTARLLERVAAVPLILGGLAVAVVANGASVIGSDALTLAACRFIAGTGGGVCYAMAITRLATCGNPTRNFGMFMVASVLQAAVLFAGMPWLDARFGLVGAFALLMGWLLVAIPLAFLLPTPQIAGLATEASMHGGAHARKVGIACLGGTLIFGLVLTATWSFIERIAAASGLALITVGTVLNVANIACVLPSVMAAWLTARSTPRLVLTCALGVTAAVLVSWPVGHEDMLGYSVRCILIFSTLTLAQIQLFAIFGSTDPTGRQAALAPASLGAGQALGPIVGAAIFAVGGYKATLTADAVFLLAVLCIYGWAFGKLGRGQPVGATALV